MTWRYIFESSLSTALNTLGFPADFGFFAPGLETAYALKYAAQNNAQSVFGGVEFDPTTIEALRTQPNLYAHTLIWKAIMTTFNTTSTWAS